MYIKGNMDIEIDSDSIYYIQFNNYIANLILFLIIIDIQTYSNELLIQYNPILYYS